MLLLCAVRTSKSNHLLNAFMEATMIDRISLASFHKGAMSSLKFGSSSTMTSNQYIVSSHSSSTIFLLLTISALDFALFEAL